MRPRPHASRMALEDHAGDVVNKARRMKGLEMAETAAAAGWTEAELAAFADAGTYTTVPAWSALGRLLDLDAVKLEAVANGWGPAPVDLSPWRQFRQFTTTGPTMDVHAYLVWDEATREAAIFDTGFTPEPIFAQVEAEGLQPRFLFITHMHGDHVAGLEAIRARYPAIELRTDADSAPARCRNDRAEAVRLGALSIANRDTPGHAPDGATYVIEGFPAEAPPVAVVGDAIFAGSMGGAPTAGALARRKVREQILTLPEMTLICPGHGPLTTVGEERAHNPFF
jgi:hydroxyacylglutathione hydrolase